MTFQNDDNNNFLVVDKDEPQKISLDIELFNKGEDAWSSYLQAEVPRDMFLDNSDESKSLSSSCSIISSQEDSETDNNLIECPIGALFRQGERKSVRLNLYMQEVTGKQNNLQIHLKMKSKSVLSTGRNTSASLNLPVKIISQIDTKRPTSEPDYIDLNFRFPPPATKKIVHKYRYENLGPAVLEKYKAVVWLPVSYNPVPSTEIKLVELSSLEMFYNGDSSCDKEHVIHTNNPYIEKQTNQNQNLLNTNKRSVSTDQNTNQTETTHPNILNCQTPNVDCCKFICMFDTPLDPKDQFELKVHANYFTDATPILGVKTLKLASTAFFNVLEFPYQINNLANDLSIKDLSSTREVSTTIHYIAQSFQDALAPKWLLLALLVGLLIVAVCFSLLHMCGFFKRQRDRDYGNIPKYKAERSVIDHSSRAVKAREFDRPGQDRDREGHHALIDN